MSVLLPAIDETTSLLATVGILEQQCAPDIKEYIVITCDRTTDSCLAACRAICDRYPMRVYLHKQSLPFLGGAIREGFELASGTHILLMASDMETDPHSAKTLLEQARRHPDAVITASRWLQPGGFTGYRCTKLVLNFLFQRFFSACYRTRLTDMTFGYRVLPSPLVKSIHWTELRHAFLFETLVKPLRLGAQVIEIPSPWRARTQGDSHNDSPANLDYVMVGLRVLFQRRRGILRADRSSRGQRYARVTA